MRMVNVEANSDFIKITKNKIHIVLEPGKLLDSQVTFELYKTRTISFLVKTTL